MKTLIRDISAIFTTQEKPNYRDPGSSVRTIENSDIVVDGSRIVEIAGNRRGHFNSGDYRIIEAEGSIITPGFVDSHTHIMYCGRRTEEFYMRLEGKTYSEILEKGGGILNTVQATRNCTSEELYVSTAERIRNALINGTTTMEIKTGYGLDLETENKMLHTINRFRDENIMRIIRTALPLHAVPGGQTEEQYLKHVLDDVLPGMMEKSDFVDIFCDRGAFSAQSAGKLAKFLSEIGKEFRMHSGEIENIGCARLASEFPVRSLDHLIHTDASDRKAMREGKSNATFLPVTAFSLGEAFPDAGEFISEGIPVSIASDSSPLTMCQNMQFAMYLAVRYCNMSPLEAFVASTVNPAASLSAGDITGTVTEGKSADLLFLSAKGVEDIPYMWNAGIINKVMYEGNIRYENRLVDDSRQY